MSECERRHVTGLPKKSAPLWRRQPNGPSDSSRVFRWDVKSALLHTGPWPQDTNGGYAMRTIDLLETKTHPWILVNVIHEISRSFKTHRFYEMPHQFEISTKNPQFRQPELEQFSANQPNSNAAHACELRIWRGLLHANTSRRIRRKVRTILIQILPT